MGAEGSVTLQLREAVQAPISNESTGATATINNALTIGYPDPEILADVLGSFQAASGDTTYDITMSDGTTHRQLFKTTSATTINSKSEGMWMLNLLEILSSLLTRMTFPHIPPPHTHTSNWSGKIQFSQLCIWILQEKFIQKSEMEKIQIPCAFFSSFNFKLQLNMMEKW